MRKRGLCCRPVSKVFLSGTKYRESVSQVDSVCPSVRLSVTLVYCIHVAEDIVKSYALYQMVTFSMTLTDP